MAITTKITFSFEEQDQLRNLGIMALYLFGSQAQGTASSHSDYDFALLLEDPKVVANREKRHQIYDGVYDILEPKIKKLCNIDIVFLPEAPLQLKFHVVRSGQILFETNPQRRVAFHEHVTLEHADFQPLWQEFRKATLARI